jgi:radical SAM-linked protein
MRIRFTFSKTEEMRYSGHLDLHRTWERTFRRAGLPLAYSQGYHPQPRINLAAALPLGFTSESELADIWLDKTLALEEIKARLEEALPPGLKITHLEEVDSQTPTLQNQVLSSEYLITILDFFPGLDQRLADMTAAGNLPRERRGKAYDLRPLIEHVQRLPDDELSRARFSIQLAARPSATGRPEEVLAVLGIPQHSTRVHRTRLIFSGEGKIQENNSPDDHPLPDEEN